MKNLEYAEGLYPYNVGFLHLRKRVKFLADEEMMTEDYYNDHPISDKLAESILESKNFKRGKDGLIYPKSGPTFPSMIVVLDRRGAK